jgi:hypothetical protein
MIGTKEVGGRKLLHVRMVELLTSSQLADLFTFFNLDWQVFSIRSAYTVQEVVNGELLSLYTNYFRMNKASFLPYIDDIWVSGTTHRPAGIDDVIYLSTYAGTEPLLL